MLPLQSLKKQSIVNDVTDMLNAIRLAELNAKTSTICALTGLTPAKVRKIITEISNKAPPKGRGIEKLDDYIKNKKHRRHVSYIVQTYRNCINLGINHVEAVIETYIIYQNTLGHYADARTTVDINHAFHLIQETNKRIEFDMKLCDKCITNYFHYKYELPLTCPFCTDTNQVIKNNKPIIANDLHLHNKITA